MHGSTRIRVVILAFIASLSLLTVAYLLTEVRGKLDELRSSANDNVQWTLSQLEVEYLEFIVTLESIRRIEQAGATRLDANAQGVSLSDLRVRFDILFSRMLTLSQSPLYRAAFGAPQDAARLDRIEMALTGLLRYFDASDAVLNDEIQEIARNARDLRPDIRSLLVAGNRVMASSADRARSEVAEVLYRLTLASSALLGAVLLIALMLQRLAMSHGNRAALLNATMIRLRTIVETSRDAILVLDERARIDTANSAAERMFGAEPGAMTQRPVGQFMIGCEGHIRRAVMSRDLEIAAREIRPGYQRVTGLRAAASFPVELTVASPESRTRPMFICILRDVSHQVAVEDQLKDSRDRALEGERAKARFLATVSHEMRTPLNGIIGALELLQDEAPRLAYDPLVKVIRESAQLLLDLVNDVLEITRIEGTTSRGAGPFDLDLMLDAIISAEASRAMACNCKVTRVRSDRPVGVVSGDERLLRQILLNLLSNAIKFSPGGMVGLAAERAADGMVVVRISDTGIGIPLDQREAIFGDFVRLAPAIDRQIPGTGLGLGIARRLARRSGGDIEVSAGADRGSVFTLRLPLPPGPEQLGPGPPATKGGAQPVAPQHVLLVEDNEVNRLIARRMLEGDGHTVTEARDGAEALIKAADGRYDTILMDLSMPGMDGAEATRRIRADPGPNRTTRVIALTAHVGDEVARRLRRDGVDIVATKPISRDSLRRLLSGQAGRLSDTGPPDATEADATAAAPTDRDDGR